MLRIPGTWIWDSWPVDDGADHHLFFLQAPKSLGDPSLRHHAATVGHAVSQDYQHWSVLPDAMRPTPAPAWDDLAIWTGSVIRGPSGSWHLFYSALSQVERGTVQRIGRADSDDLVTWRRVGDVPLLEADPRWYETADHHDWHEVAWRDPWVFPDPDGDGWHMLVTARVRYGERFTRGVVGYARSADLDRWEVGPPLTEPAGFGHMEVAQIVSVEGRSVLAWCCGAVDLSPDWCERNPNTGMWSAAAATPLGPFDVAGAAPFEDPSIYAAHVVRIGPDRLGLLGFTNYRDGEFVGEIGPPVPVRLSSKGTITLAEVDQGPGSTTAGSHEVR